MRDEVPRKLRCSCVHGKFGSACGSRASNLKLSLKHAVPTRRHDVTFYIDTSCIRRFVLAWLWVMRSSRVDAGPAPKGDRAVADTDTNDDGIADFIQGLQPESSMGLTLDTPAQKYFDEYFKAYRDALVAQRDKISNFEPLPDIITYDSALQMNKQLTTTAPGQVVDVINRYLEYLDEYKGAVDRAIKEIQAQDQA
jgi:hypothetical protein